LRNGTGCAGAAGFEMTAAAILMAGRQSIRFIPPPPEKCGCQAGETLSLQPNER